MNEDQLTKMIVQNKDEAAAWKFWGTRPSVWYGDSSRLGLKSLIRDYTTKDGKRTFPPTLLTAVDTWTKCRNWVFIPSATRATSKSLATSFELTFPKTISIRLRTCLFHAKEIKR